MKNVLVIGGGITGLSAMYELHKWKKEQNSNTRLVLAEASAELGGKIQTVHESGFVMEAGADSIVTRKAEGMSFIEELGISDEVVYNATGRSFIYVDGKLKAIPDDSVFGIPASIESLAKSTLVSAEGKVEALKDFYTGNENFTENDSVGAFLEHFLGKELVEKQIGPVLSGVYSGGVEDLTIASTLPYLIKYKEEYGSIIKGFEANRQKFQSGGEKKFLSFRNGLGTLVDSFEKQFEDVELLKNTKVIDIEKKENAYLVTFANEEVVEVDYLVLSIPHNAAESLLKDDRLIQGFSELKSSSLISVYLGFDISDDQLPMEGTGFITANTDELFCNACTWTSRKWEHTSLKGNLLVRLFYKSSHPSFADIQSMKDEEILQVALIDIKKSLDISATPVVRQITKWSNSMPNYQITHPKTVKQLEGMLEEVYPGIFLAGCSYYGVGIPDCIENGVSTARKIIQLLNK
jgi:protoporphyrinogen/coproporphyrinogen III oxidase